MASFSKAPQQQPITNGVHLSPSPSSQNLPPASSQPTALPNAASPGSLSQSNLVPSSGPSTQTQQQQQTQTQPPTQQNQGQASAQQQQQQQRPRDVRLVELLLTSLGVATYEPRVPLLLLDFAYRHTSSILTDALHHSYDPYTSHAGSRPSAVSGAAANPPPGGDATVSANSIRLAISSRLSFQYRGGTGAGGLGRDYLQEMARERNAIALPRVAPSEWGVRLPSERFVLTGSSWGLRPEGWAEEGEGLVEGDDDDDDDGGSGSDDDDRDDDDDDDETGREGAGGPDQDEDMGGMMDGIETQPGTGSAARRPKPAEGAAEEEDVDGVNDDDPGAMEDVFGDEVIDEEMEEA